MDLINWTKDFSVGVENLDDQHKTLIGMINRLITEAAVTPQSDTISDLLNEMTVYAMNHFRAEERLLAEYRYSLLAEQHAQHKEFRKRTVELCNATAQKRPSVPVELLTFLREWLVEHILVDDQKYRDFLQARGVR